jgi:succinate dehydrogenase/fumarate reductase cytochrome b subunit
LTVTLFVLVLLNNFPLTADFSAWYAGISLAITLLILAIAVFAFHSALGGRKLFQEGFLES